MRGRHTRKEGDWPRCKCGEETRPLIAPQKYRVMGWQCYSCRRIIKADPEDRRLQITDVYDDYRA